MTDKDYKSVRPINTRELNGKRIKERYKYGAIHTADVPQDFSQRNVDIEVGKVNVRWEYEGKCPILITPDGVKAEEDAPIEEAQNQAYFALSILADDGYVSHWEKV